MIQALGPAASCHSRRTERVELLARVVDQLLMDLYAVVQRVGAGELGDERREVCEMGP